MIRVVHYVNQFFGGIGGEERADAAIELRQGPVGPGRVLQRALGDEGTVVATLIGGDNYVAERPEAAAAAVGEALDRLRPDVVVAGPAFDSGRYGLACARVCALAEGRTVPAVTAMFPQNPGLSSLGSRPLCVPTGRAVTELPSAVERLARLALKLGGRQPLGSAEEEGYLPRGIRRLTTRERRSGRPRPG